MENEKDETQVDRARRRLLKLGIYLTPTLLSLTGFLHRGDAEAVPPPSPPVELRVELRVEVRVRVSPISPEVKFRPRRTE